MSNYSALNIDIALDGHSYRQSSPVGNSVAAPREPTLVPLNEATWDAVAANFNDVNQEQTSCFNSAKWGAHRLEYVAVLHGESVIAGAVIILIHPPGMSRGLAIVKWGPLWRLHGQPVDIANFRIALDLLKQEYVQSRGNYLTFMPLAEPEYSDEIVAELEAIGCCAGSELSYPARYLVNVSINPNELRQSLEQKWRYNLKKSGRNEFDIQLVSAEEGLPQFMKLYNQMLARKRFQDTSAIHTLSSLVHSNVPAHKPSFVMVYHNGEATAGAAIDTSGDRAVYLYGATDDRALPLRAGYALHWWIAEWLCAKPNIRWYDLGGTDGDPGLLQFKKGFVGKRGVIVDTPATYNCSTSIFSSLLGRSIFAARDLKELIGKVAYRVGAQAHK